MADIYLPTTLVPDFQQMQLIDSTARSESIFDGTTQTMIRPGQRRRLTLRWRVLRDSIRRDMLAVFSGLRGASGRLVVKDHTYVQNGSFAATELMPSNTFSGGTTGLTAGTLFSISASNNVLRAIRSANDGSLAGIVRPTSALTVTANLPYVGRCMVEQAQGSGSESTYGLGFGTSAFAADIASSSAQEAGYLTLACVPLSSSLHFSLRQDAGASSLAGNAIDIPFMSVSRCAMFDSGINYLQYPDDFSQAAIWVPTRLTVSANGSVAPDGTTSMDSLVEDTSNNTHLIDQTITVATAAADWAFAVALKAGTRTWARVSLVANSTVLGVYVNLSTGALGTTATGASWSNGRFYVKDMGNGVYKVTVIGTKAAGQTSIIARVNMANADNGQSYTGNSSNLYVWGATVSPSSVPMRLVHNGGTADTDGESQAVGGGLWTKGWGSAATTGLLNPGDVVEVNGRIHFVTRRIDCDADGLSRIFLNPVLHASPANNDPVIVLSPLGKYFLESAEPGYGTSPPGYQSDIELALMEALS